MSFKYRFILSFVLLEAIFIILIVTMNFVAINNSSQKLTTQTIESNIGFLDQLLKVPISIYDLATLDNLVENTYKLEYINSIIVLDSQGTVLSSKYSYKNKTQDELINSKQNESIFEENNSYEIRYKELIEEDTKLGSFYLIFDTTDNTQFINNSKTNTIYIVIVEILLSTILSFIIGSKLTQMLTSLSAVAQKIGEGKAEEVEIPYQDKKDEIGILSSSMFQMKSDLIERRKKLENLALELNKQKNQLLEANKDKDDFLANMSHELKTPLNSINVISSVMKKNKKGTFDHNEVKNLEIINSCGKDLLYLINDVLDISKLEAGEIILNEETINFQELIIGIKEMFEPQVIAKNIEFIFNLPEEIKFVYSDENRIKQIVKNLLSNAIKFVEKGSIQFLVKNKKDFFEIIIKDDGIGIEQNKLDNIFDRFKQADGSTNRKYGGTGLGLAICKELAKLLKGEITVESKLNVGTTFTLSLPKNEEKLTFQINQEKDIKENIKEDVSILLLNNDPLAFMPLAIDLKKQYNLKQVSTLIDLVKKIKVNSFNLVLIDISKERLEELKKLTKLVNAKYVFIYEDFLDKELEEKALFSLKKPFNKELLIKEINSLI